MNTAATGLVLRSQEGVRYVFDPGTLCLEFLTTGGPGDLSRYEVLHRPADLADWLALSRLRLDPAGTRVSDGELDGAHRLRAALWEVTRSFAHGTPRRSGPLEEINAAASGPPPAPRITGDGTHGWHRPVTGSQALSAIARDAVEVFTGPFATRIRECGADDCYLLFVDTSRPGKRRWCAMERCGNRHKIRALRARRESEER